LTNTAWESNTLASVSSIKEKGAGTKDCLWSLASRCPDMESVTAGPAPPLVSHVPDPRWTGCSDAVARWLSRLCGSGKSGRSCFSRFCDRYLFAACAFVCVLLVLLEKLYLHSTCTEMLTRCGRVLYIAPFMVHRTNACHAKRCNERAGPKERPEQNQTACGLFTRTRSTASLASRCTS
jgi:hypothetical protein